VSPAAIAQLFIILAPLAKDVWVEGTKIAATFRDDLTQEDINKVLEQSKSVSWPALDFK
jgi:hypothetical protein